MRGKAYCDEACPHNSIARHKDVPAGWAFTVTDPDGAVVTERYGPLLTQRGPREHVASPLYKGADAGTNQTSELGALIEFLLWLAEEAGLPTRLPPTMLGDGGKPKVIIRPDSMHAMNLAQG